MALYAAYKNELESTAAGAGGARLIGIEAIPGISASHLQAALEATKALLDSKVANVQDHGVAVTFRNTVNFEGEGVEVTDNAAEGRIDVIIAGLDDYPHVEKVKQEGVDMGVYRVLNITGSGATLTEDPDAGQWNLDIPGDMDVDVPLSTDMIQGKLRLSVPADDPDDPIAVGDNDPRLDDLRDPTDHEHTIEDLPVADNGEANADELVRSTDNRLSNARPPEEESVDLPTAAVEISLIYICDSTTRPDLPKKGQVIYETDSEQLMKNVGEPATPNWLPAAAGAASVTFQEEGVTIAQRPTVNFTGEGATVTDDAVGEKTTVAIPGLKFQSSGSDVATHATVNFIGATVANDGVNSRTNVTIATGTDASTGTKGLTKLSVAPVSSTNPIAVGDNDPRVANLYTPAWAAQTGVDSLFAAWGDGNPMRGEDLLLNGTTPTRGQLTTTQARMVMFRLPKAVSVTSVLMFAPVGRAYLVYFAIYRASDGVRMWQSGAQDYAAPAWHQISDNLPVSLAANTNYWSVMVGDDNSGSNGTIRCGPEPLGTAFYGSGTWPLTGRSIGMAHQAQVTLSSASTFPATLPTKEPASYVGGAPLVMLSGTTS